MGFRKKDVPLESNRSNLGQYVGIPYIRVVQVRLTTTPPGIHTETHKPAAYAPLGTTRRELPLIPPHHR